MLCHGSELTKGVEQQDEDQHVGSRECERDTAGIAVGYCINRDHVSNINIRATISPTVHLTMTRLAFTLDAILY
jgi:hypothetical protein